jgi:hypothetical protein
MMACRERIIAMVEVAYSVSKIFSFCVQVLCHGVPNCNLKHVNRVQTANDDDDYRAKQ